MKIIIGVAILVFVSLGLLGLVIYEAGYAAARKDIEEE